MNILLEDAGDFASRVVDAGDEYSEVERWGQNVLLTWPQWRDFGDAVKWKSLYGML